MKTYILSSGTSTTDVVKYVKDLILLNLRVPEDSIPMYEFGTPQIVTTIKDSDIESSIREVMNKVISNITSNNSDVKLSLTGLEISRNVVKVTMSINDQVAKYSISI